MKPIASFTINHDTLQKGVYLSRIDGDIVTYDIRMKKPNGGDYLSNGAIHTFEHLFATYARNSPLSKQVVYIGPMGCHTGFYLLLRDTVDRKEALKLMREAFTYIQEFEGEIPGSKPHECGNYLEHDLAGAREMARDMVSLLQQWTEGEMDYEA